MKKIFKLTMDSLSFLAKKIGISYVGINVIIWFYIIPLTWAIMGDIILKEYILIYIFSIYFTISLIIYWIIGPYSAFLFLKAVQFLDFFSKFKINYVMSSVIFCLIVPVIIYTILILLTI